MTKTTQYKNTAIGPIPIDWEVKMMRDVCKVNQGLQIPISERFSSKIENSDFYITNEFLKENSKNQYFILNAPDSVKCTKDDILMTRTGNTGMVVTGVEGAFHNNFFKIKYVLNLLEKNYLIHFLKYPKTQHEILVLAGNSTIPDLNHSDFYRLPIPLPPLPEQQKIAEILSTWDKAMQDTDAIIKKLEARNKALATTLLTGKCRIEAFKNSPSSKLEIKDVAKEISLKNKDDHNYTVFSCTKYNGLVPSLEYFGKKIYSDNLKTYKIIKRNQFAYATNHIEEGSMGILEREEIGLISPMYTIFEFNENVNLDYIFKMLKSDFYINEYKRRMEGSIDRRGGLRWNAFAQIKVNLPTLEEQNAIAEILNTANYELKQYQEKLEVLKLQKKGLMQQLLTGKIRTV